jgi:hypothetical protein
MMSEVSCVKPLAPTPARLPVSGVPEMPMETKLLGSVGSGG